MQRSAPSSFRLQAILGSGGHGQVYEAVETATGNVVALKIIRPGLAEHPPFTQALLRECRILQRLTHPNIIHIHGLSEVDERPAIVMERLHGTDLKQRIRSHGPQPVDTVISVMEQLLEGLAHIHHHQVVHRDIKPANLFLTQQGRLVLTDFGVARAADTTRSATGHMKGSLGYISPERFQGHVSAVGDVYAAGLVAWEMLTGRQACPTGEVPERMHWHMHIGPPDPRVIIADTPAWLCRLIAELVHPDPLQRPADGAAALHRLRELQYTHIPIPIESSRAADTTAISTTILHPSPANPALPLAVLIPTMLAVTTSLALVSTLWLSPAGLLTVAAALSGMLWSRGGIAWASIWLMCAALVTGLSFEQPPQTWMTTSGAGLLSWALCMHVRVRILPLTFSEVLLYMLGLTPLCTLFCSGLFVLI